MLEILKLLRQFYRRVGHRGVKILLFALFLTVHTVLSLSAELPSIDPNEFSVAAEAAWFSGRDWSSAMSQNDYYYGFFQGIIYTPVMLVTRDPFVQYKIMLIINGVMMSLIPLMVYNSCVRLGAEKPWQAGFASLICGGYITYLAHSKFIWNETAAMFFPWLIAWLMLKLFCCRKKGGRMVLSFSLGFACAMAVASHARLTAVVAAAAISLILAKAVFKKNMASLPVFFSTLVLFTVGTKLIEIALQSGLWLENDPSRLMNTAESYLTGSAFAGEGKLVRFFQSLCGQLYYFICSGWGMGALMLSLFTAVLAARISGKKNGLPGVYPDDYLIFGIFTFLSFLFTLIIGAVYKTSDESFYDYQDNLVFGRYLDGIIPLALMFVIIYLFLYKLRTAHLIGGMSASCLIFLGFFLSTGKIAESSPATRISPMLGIYPLLIGENNGTSLTGTAFIAAVSCGLCLLALLTVIVCCAKSRKVKSVIAAFCMFAATVYSGVFAVSSYLPTAQAEGAGKNAVYLNLSEYIYNQSEAPPVTVYKTPRNTAQMMQFINQEIKVTYAGSVVDIPENTIVIFPETETLRFPVSDKKIVFTEIGRTDGYLVYAYGERALAYVQSQGGDS